MNKRSNENIANLEGSKGRFDHMEVPGPSDYYKWKSASDYTVVVYFALDCIYCRQLDIYLKENASKYLDKFNLIYKPAPLSSNLIQSSEKSLITCVYQQSNEEGMSAFINSLYKNYDVLDHNNERVKYIAKSYIKDENMFKDCLINPEMIDKIQHFKSEALASSVTGVITIGIFKNNNLI